MRAHWLLVPLLMVVVGCGQSGGSGGSGSAKSYDQMTPEELVKVVDEKKLVNDQQPMVKELYAGVANSVGEKKYDEAKLGIELGSMTSTATGEFKKVIEALDKKLAAAADAKKNADAAALKNKSYDDMTLEELAKVADETEKDQTEEVRGYFTMLLGGDLRMGRYADALDGMGKYDFEKNSKGEFQKVMVAVKKKLVAKFPNAAKPAAKAEAPKPAAEAPKPAEKKEEPTDKKEDKEDKE